MKLCAQRTDEAEDLLVFARGPRFFSYVLVFHVVHIPLWVQDVKQDSNQPTNQNYMKRKNTSNSLEPPAQK